LTRTPTFIALDREPLRVDVTAVPRKKCPDKVRVKSGSYVEVTVMPILNPRVSRLSCSGGKIRCDSSDFTPNVMLQLAPHVVEETFVHTKTSAGCTPPGGWREYMMLAQGSQSTGAFEPFRVRGNQQADTVVRLGSGNRGYVNLPDIDSSISITRAVVDVVR
jgi:hypothetical protein